MLYAFSESIADSISTDYSVFTPSGFAGNADEMMALRHNLQEAQKAGDLKGQLDYTIRIGKYYQNLGINDEALSYFLQALGLSSENAGEDLIIHIQNSIAKVYLDNGMLEKAKEFNNRAVNRIRPDIEPFNSGMTYELQARIFFTETKWYKALEAAERSIKHYAESGQKEGLVRQWLLMADVYQENELYTKALKKLNEAEKALDKETDSELKARVYHHIAEIHQAEKDFEKALSYLEKGFAVAERLNNISLQEKLIRLKAETLAAAGKPEQALKAHDQLLEVLDYLDKSQSKRDLMRLEVKYRTEQQKKKNKQLRKELARQKDLQNALIIASITLAIVLLAFTLMRRYRRQRELNTTLETFNRELERRVKEQTRELEIEIEERIKKTEEAERAKLKAQESDRLKSEFLRNISHEIRTPMNRITGYSDLLSETATNPEEKEYANVIREDSERLMKLLSDILELSRLAAEDIKPSLSEVKIEEVFSRLKSKFAYKTRSGLSFHVVIPQSFKGKTVLTDRDKLEDLLSHLLDNAFKFTDHGEVTLSASVKSGGFSIYVKDTGVGIRKEQLSHIFDFFRKMTISGKRFYDGVGAGLTLVKYLTDILGGHMQVVSEPGEGTTVELYFPDVIESVEPNHLEADDSENISSRSSWSDRKLLIIDEYKSNVDFIRAILKKTGIQIVWEEQIGLALKRLSKGEQPDAVLINNSNGRADLLEMISQIKAMNYTIPVILITSASAGRSYAPANVDEVLTRPISHKILLEKLSYIFSD